MEEHLTIWSFLKLDKNSRFWVLLKIQNNWICISAFSSLILCFFLDVLNISHKTKSLSNQDILSGLSSCYHLWRRSTGWSLRVTSAPFSTLWPWHEPSKDYNDLWPYSAERPHAGGLSSASSPWFCTWHRSYPEEERAYLASRSHEPERERLFNLWWCNRVFKTSAAKQLAT